MSTAGKFRPWRIALVTPAPARSRSGNRTTAARWARILSELGHEVRVSRIWDGRACDLLVALHARKSFASVARFRRLYPDRPLVVALTGTDVYADMAGDRKILQALSWATRLIVLQPLARRELPPGQRSKTRVVFQSLASRPRRAPLLRVFEVCVMAHLREVKDPFRAALASRRLPPSSRLRVVQVGGALSPEMAARARAEEALNPRYRWPGDVPRGRALALLARSRLMVISSRLEGGANVVSEAIALGVPILASRIPGNIGLLGPRYPGYYAVGDTRALASLLSRAESDAAFLRRLEAAVRRRRPLIDPRREQRAWQALLAELGARSISRPRAAGRRGNRATAASR